MKLACRLLGHRWNGCTCTRCKTIRYGEHDYVLDKGTCAETCSICGERRAAHDWNHCTCRRCGQRRDQGHGYESVGGGNLYRCSVCGKTQYLQDGGGTTAQMKAMQLMAREMERLAAIDPDLAGKPAAQEGVRYAASIKEMMKSVLTTDNTAEGHGTFERFMKIEENAQDYGVHNDVAALLSIGPAAIPVALAAFCGEEEARRRLAAVSGPRPGKDEVEAVVMEALRAWFERRRKGLPAREEGFYGAE